MAENHGCGRRSITWFEEDVGSVASLQRLQVFRLLCAGCSRWVFSLLIRSYSRLRPGALRLSKADSLGVEKRSPAAPRSPRRSPRRRRFYLFLTRPHPRLTLDSPSTHPRLTPSSPPAHPLRVSPASTGHTIHSLSALTLHRSPLAYSLVVSSMRRVDQKRAPSGKFLARNEDKVYK